MTKKKLNGETRILLARLDERFDAMNEKLDRYDQNNTIAHEKFYKKLERPMEILHKHSKKIVSLKNYVRFGGIVALLIITVLINHIMG